MAKKSTDRRREASLSTFLDCALRALGRSQWLVLGMAAFVCILGVWGFASARGPGGETLQASDVAYRTLQLFLLDHKLEPAWTAPLVLELARFFAVIFLVLAFVRLLGRRIVELARLALQGGRDAQDNRVVLIGYGSANRQFAKVARARGHLVTAVTRRADDATRDSAARDGVLLVEGDATEVATLERVRAGSCRRAIVCCGDDVRNLEVATAVAEMAEDAQVTADSHAGQSGTPRPATQRETGYGPDGLPRVYAHLSSTRMLADVAEARDVTYSRGGRVRGFSLKRTIARDLIDRARLDQRVNALRLHSQFEANPSSGEDRPSIHVVIVGFGDTGEAILVEALQASYAAGLGAPRITILDRGGEPAIKARLSAHRARLLDDQDDAWSPTLAYGEADASCLGFEESMFDAIEKQPVTAWVFACRDDATNLSAALRLEMAMHQMRRRPAPIFAREWSAATVGERRQRNPLRFVETFGAIETIAHRADPLDEDLERLAMAIHADHRTTEGTTAEENRRFTDAWQALPENVRESNRMAARHAAVKLRDLGLTWRGMRDGYLPHVSRSFVDDYLAGDASEAVQDDAHPHFAIAEAEKRRWNVDRILAGWRPAPFGGRDDRSRLHDALVDFTQLIDPPFKEWVAIRSWDLSGTGAILSFLTRAEAQWRPQASEELFHTVRLDPSCLTEMPLPVRPSGGTTEFRIVVGKGLTGALGQMGDADAFLDICQRLSNVVAGWSATEAASRLHFVLEEPVAAPVVAKSVVSGKADAQTLVAAGIATIADSLWLLSADDDRLPVACDATWLYGGRADDKPMAGEEGLRDVGV